RVVDNRDVMQRGVLEEQFGTSEPGPLVPSRRHVGRWCGRGGARERPAEHHIHNDHVGSVGAEVREPLPELLLGDESFDACRRERPLELILQQGLLEVVVLDDDDERFHSCSLGNPGVRQAIGNVRRTVVVSCTGCTRTAPFMDRMRWSTIHSPSPDPSPVVVRATEPRQFRRRHSFASAGSTGSPVLVTRTAAQSPYRTQLRVGTAVEPTVLEGEVDPLGRYEQRTAQLVLQVLQRLGLAAQGGLQLSPGLLQPLEGLPQVQVQAELVTDDLAYLKGVGRYRRTAAERDEDAVDLTADLDRRTRQPARRAGWAGHRPGPAGPEYRQRELHRRLRLGPAG